MTIPCLSSAMRGDARSAATLVARADKGKSKAMPAPCARRRTHGVLQSDSNQNCVRSRVAMTETGPRSSLNAGLQIN
jgi:hypothetical protein